MWQFLTVYTTVCIAFMTSDQPRPTAADDPRVTGSYLAEVREVARHFARLVEALQEDIADEFSGPTERTLYHNATSLLQHVAKLESSLKPGAERKALYALFDDLDKQRASVGKAIQELGGKKRALQRDMERISGTADELAYILAIGDQTEVRKRQVLERQIHSLAVAAKSLSKAAEVAFEATPGRAKLQDDLKKLTETCEQQVKTSAEVNDRDQVRKQCAAVNLAWERAVHNLRILPPREMLFLIRPASRINATYERVFRMLEMTGKPPELVVGT